MSLGNIIKNYREVNRMSMDDFSRVSGISKAYISMLEKNINPRTGKAQFLRLNISKKQQRQCLCHLTNYLLC